MKLLFSIIWILFTVVTLEPLEGKAQDIPLFFKTTTACYGHGDRTRDFLQPTCAAGERIGMRKIKHGVKMKTSNCPSVLTANDTTVGKCCSVEPTDCHFRLSHSQTWNYFQECSGLQKCSVRVGREQVLPNGDCNETLHMLHSSYMEAEYYCIPDSSIVNVESTGKYEYSSFFLSHLSYPGNMASHQDYICYVNTHCGSNITILALDLQISCDQHIAIGEGDRVHNKTCGFNNSYNIKTLHFTSSPFFAIVIPDVYVGRFWLHMSASNSQAMAINCGTTSVQYTGESCSSSNMKKVLGTSAFYQRSSLSSDLQTRRLSGYETFLFDLSTQPIKNSRLVSESMSPEYPVSSENEKLFSVEFITSKHMMETNTVSYQSQFALQNSQSTEIKVAKSASSDSYMEPSFTSDTLTFTEASRYDSIGYKDLSLTTETSSHSPTPQLLPGGLSTCHGCSTSSYGWETSPSTGLIVLDVSSIKSTHTEIDVSTTDPSSSTTSTFPAAARSPSNTTAVVAGTICALLIFIGLLVAAFILKRKFFTSKVGDASVEDGGDDHCDESDADPSRDLQEAPEKLFTSGYSRQVPPLETGHFARNTFPKLPSLHKKQISFLDKRTDRLALIDDSLIDSVESITNNDDHLNRLTGPRHLPPLLPGEGHVTINEGAIESESAEKKPKRKKKKKKKSKKKEEQTISLNEEGLDKHIKEKKKKKKKSSRVHPVANIDIVEGIYQ